LGSEAARDFKGVVADTFAFLLVFVALVLVQLVIRTLPYDPSRKEILDTLHYYTALCLLVMLSCDLIWKIGLFILGKQDRNE